MFPFEYGILNHLLKSDSLDLKETYKLFGEKSVKGCITKGWAKKEQDYDKYWDDKERLSLTSMGILELNIFEKSEGLNKK